MTPTIVECAVQGCVKKPYAYIATSPGDYLVCEDHWFAYVKGTERQADEVEKGLGL